MNQSGFLPWCHRHAGWLLPIACALLYFSYGLTVISEYGVTWDEPLHRNWGKLFMYFWKTGDRQALELMPGHGINYGSLYYAVNYLLSERLYALGWLRFVEANHVLNLLVASAGIGLTFVLGRMLGGIRIGCIAVVCIALFPQLLAHAQYNPKDIPLMTVLLLTAVTFLSALRSGSPRSILLAAFLMGASVAFKVSALLMAPVFACSYLVWVFTDDRAAGRSTIRDQAVIVGVGILAVIAGAYLFWPDAWGDPLLLIRSIRFFLGTDFWPGKVLFFGTEYAGAALPWYYIPFEFFGAAPLIVFVAFLTGVILLLLRFGRSLQRAESLLVLLWIFFPLAFSMKPGLVRYDGIRQFLFIIPAMAVLAAFGFSAVFDALGRRIKVVWVLPLLAMIIVGYLAKEIAVVHPYEGSYRNELVRMLYPTAMDRSFQIEYWGPTYKQGMEWLIAHAEPNPIICVPTAGVLIEWYPWREDFTFDCSKNSQYVMFFTRYSEAGEFAKLDMTPVFTIDRMGARLLSIYKVK